jgi:DNA-directed RNA polymerase alpha subunit
MSRDEAAERGGAARSGSDAPVSDLPAQLARPAQRALAAAGYTRLEQFIRVTEAEVLRLHGMGPKALDQIRRALDAKGLSFAGDPRGVPQTPRRLSSGPDVDSGRS